MMAVLTCTGPTITNVMILRQLLGLLIFGSFKRPFTSDNWQVVST